MDLPKTEQYMRSSSQNLTQIKYCKKEGNRAKSSFSEICSFIMQTSVLVGMDWNA